jgi:adenine-specific DNA-methyltransferase
MPAGSPATRPYILKRDLADPTPDIVKPSGLIETLRPREGSTGRFTELSAEKLRGGYYTPEAVAAWLCKWAIRQGTDSFLEPSCGDGSILVAAAERLIELGAKPTSLHSQLHGIELLPSEAAVARGRLVPLLGSNVRSIVEVDDFFARWPVLVERQYTTIIGNPPFIRYQSFPEPARSRAMAIMEKLGLHPNRLTNIWVPFVAAAVAALKPGGRLALVLPAELLQVSYAAQIRSFLAQRFSELKLVACNELIFNGAEQEVMFLLAEGALAQSVADRKCQIAVAEVAKLHDVLDTDPAKLFRTIEAKEVHSDREKWLKYFLTASEIELMRELRAHQRIVELRTVAEVDVGIVTGANSFFVLRFDDIKRAKLSRYSRKIISRSAHLRGARISEHDWEMLSDRNERVHLLDMGPLSTPLSASALAYIEAGENAGVNRGYKCSIRQPWFRVPAIWQPDAFLFRQIHDFPRFVLNEAGAVSTDTIHRVRTVGCAPATLVSGTFSHLTAASAEIEGRSYGGGVLELEPTEAERLLVPDITGLERALPLEECDRLIRAGRLAVVLHENDQRILHGELGLSERDCTMLYAIWAKMRDRRFARRRYKRSATM